MNGANFDELRVAIMQNGFGVEEVVRHPEHFDSWHVTIAAAPRLRIVWDGREGWLIVQQETTEIFNGSIVWRDLWIAKTASQKTPERVIQVLRVHHGAA